MKRMKVVKGFFTEPHDLQGSRLLMGMLLAVMGLAAVAQTTSAGAQQAASLADYHEVRWSPDGQRLAVVMRTDPKSNFRIAIIPADGGEPRWLTTDSRGAMMPRWSPNGTRIAHITSTDPFPTKRLEGADVDGGPARPVTTAGRVGQFDSGYTWTRDGSQIAFHELEPGVFVVAGKIRIPATRIYLAGSHGEEPRPLGGTEELPETSSWSPDGKTILYSLYRRPIDGPTLWSIGVDGKGNRPLAADGIRGQYSPDGQWIADVDSRGTDSPANPSGSSYYHRVCKVRPDGSGVVVIAR